MTYTKLKKRIYKSGDDEKFFNYLKCVRSSELKKILYYARKNLKHNIEFLNKEVYHRLEKTVEKQTKGELDIKDYYFFDWEMLGRPYETIFRFFSNANKEETKKIRDTSWERAIMFYLKSLKINRAMTLFKEYVPEDQNLKEKIEKEINKIIKFKRS
ncbi:hypothetical protein DRJ22_04500 [Candidatus Woesearchaeota archaeon]|nr:MAG: hypothetical protein DRJ22_04500 [Candidatus Woesearchaeota archaeon]